jgi:hypothetical protein
MMTKPGFEGGLPPSVEADSFGEVYPFSEQISAQSHVVANTAELVMVSRQRLMRASQAPHVERGIIRLCRIHPKTKRIAFNGVRKGHRYRFRSA